MAREVIGAEDVTRAINTLYESAMAARADIKPELFDLAIRQKGYRIRWEQGMYCSCADRQSGQPNYVCPACKNKGFVYFNPTEIRALVTSISGTKDQNNRVGLDELGTAYLTPESRDKIGYRDRFTFLDFTIKFSEVIRGKNTLKHELRYPAKKVLSVRILNEEYQQGIHYNLSDDGWYIIWEEMPAYGDLTYSILYTTNPVYIAIGPIHELRGTYTLRQGQGREVFLQLPDQYQIKREDFLLNE